MLLWAPPESVEPAVPLDVSTPSASRGMVLDGVRLFVQPGEATTDPELPPGAGPQPPREGMDPDGLGHGAVSGNMRVEREEVRRLWVAEPSPLVHGCSLSARAPALLPNCFLGFFYADTTLGSREG